MYLLFILSKKNYLHSKLEKAVVLLTVVSCGSAVLISAIGDFGPRWAENMPSGLVFFVLALIFIVKFLSYIRAIRVSRT